MRYRAYTNKISDLLGGEMDKKLKISNPPKIKKGNKFNPINFIPDGPYCYNGKVGCPFWLNRGKVYIEEYDEWIPKICCNYLNQDTIEEDGLLLIYDSIKQCGVNDEYEYQEALDKV